MIATTSPIVVYTTSSRAPTLNPVRARTGERERGREGEREGDISFHLLLFLFPSRGCRSLYAYGESHPWMIFWGGSGVLGIFSSTVSSTFKVFLFFSNVKTSSTYEAYQHGWMKSLWTRFFFFFIGFSFLSYLTLVNP